MDVAKATTPPTFEPTNENTALPLRSQAQKHQLLSRVKKATFLLAPQIGQFLIHQHWPYLCLLMTFLQLVDQVKLLGFGNLHTVPRSVDTNPATVPHRYHRGWICQVLLLDTGRQTILEFAKSMCTPASQCQETLGPTCNSFLETRTRATFRPG